MHRVAVEHPGVRGRRLARKRLDLAVMLDDRAEGAGRGHSLIVRLYSSVAQYPPNPESTSFLTFCTTFTTGDPDWSHVPAFTWEPRLSWALGAACASPAPSERRRTRRANVRSIAITAILP
ncbi:MAG TPA: hypothetical protein VFC42_13370 [Methylomirabilota bacterium]|nr:hypothetical protein [Methylomirabilota bacterium]